MNMNARRNIPNILVVGTPGTGKSTLCNELCERSNLEYINIGDVARSCHLYTGYDPELECPIIDEDRVVSEIEDRMFEGGKVVEFHGCDFFPESWFDIIFVLTTDNTLLYDRLARRGYKGVKLENNIQCEIFQTVLDEAKEAYDPEIVYKLVSNTPEDMESNLDRICLWVETYKSQNANG